MKWHNELLGKYIYNPGTVQRIYSNGLNTIVEHMALDLQ